ncbi:MAG: AAA family ATPase [Anaerolineae bacterium]|nr:AAA family ATPase [Anaerolineae bacterium]
MEPQQAIQPYGAPAYEAKALPFQPPARVLGRNGELAAIYSLVRNGAAALLWGPPGAGKSTLASVVASAYLGGKQGGVLWLNAPDDNLDHLVARIGRAFGADTFSPALGDRARHVKAARALLTKNRPLVILDGILDLGLARDFVQSCAVDIPLILTADEDGAGPWTTVELRPLSDSDAQETFRYYSGLREAAHQPDIAGLCRALDGLPLTVELAARLAAVDDLAPAEILNLLPAGKRDSLEAVLAILFNRLNPAVQGVALVLAAAYAATATTELIASLSNVPADRVAPLMRQLILRGLARETRAHTQRAFALHEAVQRYALARLRSAQKLPALEMRTLETVIGYAGRHAADGDGLAAEIDNVLAAAAYATSHGQNDALRRLIAIFEDDAADFVQERGFQPELEELRNLLRLAEAESPGEKAAPAPVKAETRPAPPESGPGVSPHALPATPPPPAEATMPVALRPSAEETRAVASTETLQAITPETALSPVDSDALATPILPPPGDETLPALVTPPPAAPEAPPTLSTEEVTLFSLDTLHAQLDEARLAGDQAREAPILQTIGRYHLDHEEPAGADEAYRNALIIFEQRGDRDGQISTLDALAGLALGRGDTEQALDYAQRGVKLAEEVGDTARLGHLLMTLAEAQAARGLPALDTYARAVEALRTAEDWDNVGVALERLGDLYMAHGQSREALMMLEQALTIFHRQNMLDHEVSTLIKVGSAYAGQGLGPLAHEFLERAVFLARESFNRAGEARALAAIAALHRAANETEDLKRRLRQALYAAFLAGDSAQRAAYARELGLMMVDDTRTLAQAVELLREASASDPADTEVRRLLQRAETRLQRLTTAGSAPPPAEGPALEYAAHAYSV